MQTRTFGKESVTVSEVGLGCWQFGGDFGPMQEQTAFDIMQASVDAGVTFFDTADVYGGGRSEALIGRFLAQADADLFVATKLGRGADIFPDGYTEEALRNATRASMTRLGVESLDLTQLHCVPTEILRDGAVFDWLRRMRDQGMIKRFGASVESVEQAAICMQQPDLASLQIIFNIFRPKPIAELLPEARDKGVAVIVRLPLASGLLAGKYTAQTTFVESDHRNYNRDGAFFNVGETFAGLPFDQGLQAVEAVRPILPDDIPMAQAALRWVLDHDAVSVIIPGASSVAQAQSNAAASDLPPLSRDVHTKLMQVYREKVHEHIRGPY